MMGPWDQRDGEPDRAYALFEGYLALGPGRRLRQLADASAASLSYLKQLSARWRWRERAAAWQAEMGRSGHPVPRDELEAIRESQLKEARLLRALGRAQIQRALSQGAGGRARPRTVARLWRQAFGVEHLLLPRQRPPGEEGEEDPDRAHAQERDPEAGRLSREHPSLEGAMAELLALAKEAGVPEEALPEVREVLLELVGELHQILRATAQGAEKP